MTEIVWGPEIAVDGKRPEWLEPEDAFQWEASTGWGWQNTDGRRCVNWKGPDGTVRIRLPADHPHYAASKPHPAPSPSEVGPEVVEITRMTQEEAEARGELCGYGSFGRQGYVQCLRDLGLILPEPVDVDEAIAEEMAAAGEDDFVTPYSPERRKRLKSQLLAAIRRGRELERQNG